MSCCRKRLLCRDEQQAELQRERAALQRLRTVLEDLEQEALGLKARPCACTPGRGRCELGQGLSPLRPPSPLAARTPAVTHACAPQETAQVATAEQRAVDVECQHGRDALRASADEQGALERAAAATHGKLRVRPGRELLRALAVPSKTCAAGAGKS